MSLLGMTSAVVLSLSPFLEVRGAIPVAVAFGLNVWIAFILAVLANIALIPIVYFFLDYIHVHMMKISIYSRVFEMYLGRVRRKAEEKVVNKTWPYFALCGFVGLPLPGTGVWTGVLVSWFFKMSRRKSFISLALGSILVSLLTTFAVIGFVKLW